MPWSSGDSLSPTNLNTKETLTFSATDPAYSLDSSGAADSRASLVSLISDAASVQGIAYLPEGIYLIDTSNGSRVEISDNSVTLLGAGPGSIISANYDNAADPLRVTGRNVTLRNFAVKGNRGQTNEAHAVRFNNAIDGLAENLYVEDSGLVGIIAASNCTRVNIVGCKVINAGSSGIELLQGATLCTIDRNYVEGANQGDNSSQAGITILGSTTPTKNSIINNTVVNSRSNGIRVEAVSGVFAQDVRVIGNSVETTGLDNDTSEPEGIVMSCHGGTCVGNTVRAPWTTGIFVFGAARDVTVTGNVISNPSQATVSSHAAIELNCSNTTMRNIVVTGNVAFDDQGTQTLSRAVDVTNNGGDLVGCLIANNSDRSALNTNPVNVDSTLTGKAAVRDNLQNGALYATLPITITAGDTTPDVSNGNFFVTANTSATTIQWFDGGSDGQEVTVLVDSNTSFQSNATMLLQSASDFVGTADDTISFRRSGTSWYETARSVN